MKRLLAALLLCALPATAADKKKGEEEEPEPLLSAGTFGGLELRGLGPAISSGRIVDLAIHPSDRRTWYAAAASGGLWKTTNAGTQWTPIFDEEGSYSIGCVTIDPGNPLVVWVGTGENNSQRSVAYGDGVYKSVDGGTSWTNMGLKESEHIGRIVVDPRDSKVVWVAAQGPLWRAGGDRGVYKTTDGGTTWNRVLHVDEHTGANEVWIDPRDPDVLYASTYQRARRVWTLIDGGPGSGIHKSTDGGATWEELTNGLPEEDMGKIGLAVSPADPDVVYAIVESIAEEGGIFRSQDGGANWEKVNDYVSSSPQYYNELVPHPHDPDTLYSMDFHVERSTDGGKSWDSIPENAKHVDNHALWIDPDDTDHFVDGCDGGVYETFDAGETWRFFENLPITQFYKIAVDDAQPFYNVYGGTQDNSTWGGPSRTTSDHGITHRDWFVVVGGDGFDPAVEPGNPDIVYGQYQHAGIVRYDRRTGESIDIQPQPGPGEPASRWNWDTAFAVSPHSPTRLYIASQRVYRSEDRGDTWTAISPDLTRQIDRNRLEVMGRVWGVDTVAKNRSTSFYGNIISLTESPLAAGLIYIGSDDGLVQVTEDGGGAWRRIERFPGVPEMTYVSDLEASRHDPDTVFAAFDNHKMGDFEPYLLKSADRGATWTSIAGDLPERGSVYTVAEDHVDPDLLFAGTEFGVYFSIDGGGKWIELEGGMPTIAVRDLEIQRRENDLVVGTFGRGFYILDDYTPLREVSEELLGEAAVLFPARKAPLFMKSYALGYNDKAFMGDSFYAAPNPPLGAVFTYYLKEGLQTRREQRRESEKEIVEKGEALSYPSWDDLRAEDREEDPAMILTVRDETGAVVRRVTGPVEKGFQRVAWDLRYPPADPTSLEEAEEEAFDSPPIGPLAVPGTYSVTLAQRVEGALTELAGPVSFEIAPALASTLAETDRAALTAFQRQTARLQRAVLGATEAAGETATRITHLRKAALDTPAGDPAWLDRLDGIEGRLEDLQVALEGDSTVASRSEPTPPAITDRVGQVVSGHWTATSAPTATHRRNYEIAAEAFAPVLEGLHGVEADLAALEAEMEAAGAPWTPGRLPRWEPQGR
ncbi:MAG: WD40/YVTN/BNR-like repeat-containing protein [Thermoanaerobaculia bacterium]